MINFFSTFLHYIIDILPSLLLGFLLSGIVHEFVPQQLINKYLTNKGIKPILYTTLIGMLLPLCCCGVLPLAVSLKRKGVPLGPILAFIIATPATSLTAILVTWRLLGIWVTLYLCLSVVLMGFVIGIIGNLFPYKTVKSESEECSMCEEGDHTGHQHHKKGFKNRIISILTFGFIDTFKELWRDLLIGIVLASVIASVKPLGEIITKYITGWQAYLIALVFGLLMYSCATGDVPMVHALISRGLSKGAGMVLLIGGPVTSYATILVMRREFGMKILLLYLGIISLFSLGLGCLFDLIKL